MSTPMTPAEKAEKDLAAMPVLRSRDRLVALTASLEAAKNIAATLENEVKHQQADHDTKVLEYLAKYPLTATVKWTEPAVAV